MAKVLKATLRDSYVKQYVSIHISRYKMYSNYYLLLYNEDANVFI